MSEGYNSSLGLFIIVTPPAKSSPENLAKGRRSVAERKFGGGNRLSAIVTQTQTLTSVAGPHDVCVRTRFDYSSDPA